MEKKARYTCGAIHWKRNKKTHIKIDGPPNLRFEIVGRIAATPPRIPKCSLAAIITRKLCDNPRHAKLLPLVWGDKLHELRFAAIAVRFVV